MNALEQFIEVLAEHNEALEKISKSLDTLIEHQDIIARNLDTIYNILRNEHNQSQSN